MRVAFGPDVFRRVSCAIVAVGTTFCVAGCSDQSTRFNYPALGLADSGSANADYSTTSSLPPSGGYNGTAPKRAASYTSANQTRYYGSQQAARPPASGATYASGPRVTVRQGDTLTGISRQYGVPIGTIQAANNLGDTPLRAGQVLVLPGANMAAASRPAPRVAAPAPAAPPVQQAYAQPAAPAARKVTTTTIAPAETTQSTSPAAPASSSVASNAQLPTPEPLAGNSFRWPVKGHIVSGFGTKADGGHNDGINISVPQGTPVRAAENGVVAYAGNELKGYGNLVLVRHANNWVSAYANNEQILVKRGDKVSRGQVIAKAGTGGSVSQPQVHFELRKGSRPVDPTKYMSSMAAQAD